MKIQMLKWKKKTTNIKKSYDTIIKEIDHIFETNKVILEEFDDAEHHYIFTAQIEREKKTLFCMY